MQNSKRLPGFTAEASLARSERPLASPATVPFGTAQGAGREVVPAMRCVFKDDDTGFCCTASNYCCIWQGWGTTCGQMS